MASTKTPKFNRTVISLLEDRDDIQQVIDRINQMGISADAEEVTNNFSVNDTYIIIPKIRALMYAYRRMIDTIMDNLEI